MADRYQIKGRIGRGGIGAIYLAYDTTLKRDVAIKRLLPLEETNLNESAENTLNREAEALSRLQHPNVITLFAFEEDEEGPFVVMEYIEGDTLKDTIDNGALSLEDFQIVANQCLDPLITAQQLGLLHRDIKPANIMLQWLSSGNFQVKILDFGLAKFSQTPSLQTLDQTGSFLGSIEYLAPEQLELKPLDPRTDIYSLGCVFYYCLAQRSPFDGGNPATTTSNHLAHVVTHISEIREDIPQPVADWLMLLISRQPADRPRDASEALQMFNTALAGQTPRVGANDPAATAPGSAPVAPPPSVSGPVHVLPEPSGPVAPPPSVSGPVHVLPEPSGPVAPPPTVSGPVHVLPEPSGPVAPPPTVSGPVPSPSKKMISGPQRTAAEAANKKLITSPVTHSGPSILITETDLRQTITGSQTVSAAATAQTGRPSKKQAPKSKGMRSSASFGFITQAARDLPPTVWAIAGLVIVVLALLGYLVVSKGGGSRHSNAPPVQPSQEESADTISQPPVSKGLVLKAGGARSVLSTHTDTPVEDQGQLLFSSSNANLLGFEILREKDDSEVFLTEALPAINKELKYSQPAIRFDAGAAVDFRCKDDDGFFFSASGLTFVAVINPENNYSDVFRVDTKTKWGKILTRINNGFFSEMPIGRDRARITTEAPTDQFVILTLVWNGAKETHQLFVVTGDGKRYDSPAGVAPKEPMDIKSLTFGDDHDETKNLATGQFLELLVFDRALHSTERTELEEYYRHKFFKK